MTNHPETWQRVDDDDQVIALMAAEDADRHDFEMLPVSTWLTAVIPTPSPFTQSRYSGLIARAPIRIAGSEDPTRIDPRHTRFTEIVGSILNSLIAGGVVYQSSTNQWSFSLRPRSVAGNTAFDGELFFDTTTSKLSYRDSGGSIHELY